MINLTQHKATAEQVAAGVVDLPSDLQEEVSRLLTFDAPPRVAEMFRRANALAALVTAFDGPSDVMIGGAPFFMSALERGLSRAAHAPHYAFSLRESVDQTQPDGSVRKVAIFRHAGFVRSAISEEVEADFVHADDLAYNEAFERAQELADIDAACLVDMRRA